MFELSFNCPTSPSEMKPIRSDFKCDLCAHKVIDFTGMNNNEIQQVLLQNAGKKTCGVYKESQLNNPERSKQFSIFRLAFVAVFVLGMNAVNCFGQDTLANETIKEVELETVTIYFKHDRGTIGMLEERYHVGQNPWGNDRFEEDEVVEIKRRNPIRSIGQRVKSFFVRLFKFKTLS